MPIFVKGELLQRSLACSRGDEYEETRMTEFINDNKSALMRVVLPSCDERSQFVDPSPTNAFAGIHRTIGTTKTTNPLADDLSSVGSLSNHSLFQRPVQRAPQMSVVQPIAEYDSTQDVLPGFSTDFKRGLSIDTNYGGGDSVSQIQYSTRSNASSIVSPYNLNPIQSWEWQRRHKANVPSHARLSVLTTHDESREDLGNGFSREPPQPPVRDPLLESLAEETDNGDDEPSRTLDDLIGLLEKGYRVKLHTFRGREKAFLFLRRDVRILCLKKEDNTKRDDSGYLYLSTPIDDIESLEFGRRSDSGFLLSPLTSFSLGIKDKISMSETRYFDLEAASPVQREVLVSTLMIMMDAFGNDAIEDANESLNEDRDLKSGTFDQPIVCSPSLDAIPCSPSLDVEVNFFGSQSFEVKREPSKKPVEEVFHIDDANSIIDDDNVNLMHTRFIRAHEREFVEDMGNDADDESARQVKGRNPLLDDLVEVSSGEITDQTSNKTGSIASGLDVVTRADDLEIEAHLSDQAFHSSQGASTESDIQPVYAVEEHHIRGRSVKKLKSFSSDTDAEKSSVWMASSFSNRDESKETSYVFKEEESVLSGSAAMPINVETGSDPIDPITTLRSNAHALSFSFSDNSFDFDGNESVQSVQGMLHSVRSRRSGHPMVKNLPSYPSRIIEVEEPIDMSFQDVSPMSREKVYRYREYQTQESQDRTLDNEEQNDFDWGSAKPSTIEITALVDIPRLEVPTPHKIHMTGSSSHLGGWCSDDVCTGTLNDMAKTCSGIFAAQQTQYAISNAACIDPTLTEEQTAILEEYIASALGAPTAMYSYFADGEELSTANATIVTTEPTAAVDGDHAALKFRNRAARSNAQADRIRQLKNEMTFAHALKHSKEMSAIRTTQSFDDAKLLPKIADKAANELHSSPLLDSLVSNMMNQWSVEAKVDSPNGVTKTEEDSVYYDSDPEDSRPRTMHHGPRNVRPQRDAPDNDAVSRPKALDGFGIERVDAKLSKKTDEDTIKEVVQSMMNERLLVMWHPTQSKDKPNRAPILARLWIESGVYLIDGSFLLPKLSWVKAFGKTSEGVLTKSQDLQKVDLLDICRIRSCDKVDRSLHPFANGRLSWYIETQQDVFLFESETAEERNRIVYGLKLVVARLASLLMLRDIRAADEFFGAVSTGVPGEAPIWTAGDSTSNKDETPVWTAGDSTSNKDEKKVQGGDASTSTAPKRHFSNNR